MFKTLREISMLLRIAQCHLSARYYQFHIDHNREGLAKALAAGDEARAALVLNDMTTPPAEVPLYLLKQEQ
jgi:hypothetical protein